jgi:hypothetical protein
VVAIGDSQGTYFDLFEISIHALRSASLFEGFY